MPANFTGRTSDTVAKNVPRGIRDRAMVRWIKRNRFERVEARTPDLGIS